jgi:hypothetical protein
MTSDIFLEEGNILNSETLKIKCTYILIQTKIVHILR